MEKHTQDMYEHINILKKLDSYMQHQLSDWDFKEFVRTVAIEIENNRRLIADLHSRVMELENKAGIIAED